MNLLALRKFLLSIKYKAYCGSIGAGVVGTIEAK